MPRRQDFINSRSLPTLFAKHPYLAVFQKESWVDYLDLLSQVYDHIEETGQQAPYAGVRVLVLKFFRKKDLQFVEQKAGQFFVLCLEELKVLKDFHDKSGQRQLETTRAGKQLLQLVESLLAQKVKYSGTAAETLLAALNDAFVSQHSFSMESAIQHHEEKIGSYKQDIKRIKSQGVGHAELLPVPHSIEALFSQAEHAAIDIMFAVEDVKQAIELERKKLAESYLDSERPAGKSLNTVADFYETLHQAVTYQSYTQAKDLFSFLEGQGSRFPKRRVSKILYQLEEAELISADTIKKSQLESFQKQFELADLSIQEKTRAQLRLLQLQVRYSMSTNVKGLQAGLKHLLQAVFQNKEDMLTFFADENGFLFEKSAVGLGGLELYPFEQQEVIDEPLHEEEFAQEERQKLIEALLQAEEITLKQVVSEFKKQLQGRDTVIKLSEYEFQHGLAEYYVLSEIELFTKDIVKVETSQKQDLELSLKGQSIIIRNCEVFEYSLRERRDRDVYNH